MQSFKELYYSLIESNLIIESIDKEKIEVGDIFAIKMSNGKLKRSVNDSGGGNVWSKKITIKNINNFDNWKDELETSFGGKLVKIKFKKTFGRFGVKTDAKIIEQ